jgi:hypothetical protein
VSRKEDRSEIAGVIELCQRVKSGNLDPFNIDVDYVLNVIRKYYPKIKNYDDLCIDAKAINEISSVLEHQNKWIRHQSTILYKDPFMLNQQILLMDIGSIADVFLRSWHPLVELEQMSAQTLANSLGYWENLLPIDMRWKESEHTLMEVEIASVEEAIRLGFISQENFADLLEKIWIELEQMVGEGGSVDYWDWIGRETYEETVKRAYLTSFMVGYDYAKLETEKFGETIKLIHSKEPSIGSDRKKVSIPVMIDYEEWKRWREK